MTTASEALSRRKAILRAIVDDYVASCSPVASGQLVRKHALGVSSATVRKDMAHLEEEGFIYQPHTSAGRVPSNTGYRYFVAELLPSTDLTYHEADRLQSELRPSVHGIADLLELARAILASFLGNVAFVTLPLKSVRLKRVTMITHAPGSARMIVELSGAPIQDHLLTGMPVEEPSWLEICGRELTDGLAGKRAAEIDALPPPESELKYEIRVLVTTGMRSAERNRLGGPHYVGLAKMIDQPEFRDVELVQRGVTLLETGDVLNALDHSVTDARGVAVAIGGEDLEFLRGYSAILTAYGADDEFGILGVLGPSRMPYRKTIGAVRKMAETVTVLTAAAG